MKMKIIDSLRATALSTSTYWSFQRLWGARDINMRTHKKAIQNKRKPYRPILWVYCLFHELFHLTFYKNWNLATAAIISLKTKNPLYLEILSADLNLKS